jgi:hypothetical protein
MWSPDIAHLFHLKRADMLDYTLHEYIAMVDATRTHVKANS